MLKIADAAPVAPTRRRGRPLQDSGNAVDEATMLGRAFRTFAERGYEGTTLRELAKALGVSHNLIHVRFGRKEALWKRAVDWRLTAAALPVEATFEEAADPETRLRHLVHRFCAWATHNSDVVALTRVEGSRSTWRLDHLVEHFIAPFQRRLDALLGEVAAHRTVRPISTAALMALLVQGVGFFFGAVALQQRIGAGAEVDPRHAEQGAASLADFLLAGLLP
jgi:AcrR family transcriptional regulator